MVRVVVVRGREDVGFDVVDEWIRQRSSSSLIGTIVVA